MFGKIKEALTKPRREFLAKREQAKLIMEQVGCKSVRLYQDYFVIILEELFDGEQADDYVIAFTDKKEVLLAVMTDRRLILAWKEKLTWDRTKGIKYSSITSVDASLKHTIIQYDGGQEFKLAWTVDSREFSRKLQDKIN
jgi:hypothetical protein